MKRMISIIMMIFVTIAVCPFVTAEGGAPVITAAQTDTGEIYPAFSPDIYYYTVVIKNTDTPPVLTFKTDGAKKVLTDGKEIFPQGEEYSYEIKRKRSGITLIGDNEEQTEYSFLYRKAASFDVPDRVSDYLCIGSQYTNNSYGKEPETTLSGLLKSLGNFGGYITYYYSTPIVNDPKNKYGMDLYIIGNCDEKYKESMAEPGQVYVSEDQTVWYALAGSEHYDGAVRDYSVTYKKDEQGLAQWEDSLQNRSSSPVYPWPDKDIYYLNRVSEAEEYTFGGVLLKAADGSITGNGTNGAFARPVRFGYVDCYSENISDGILEDTNPYIADPSGANGFDLEWAVDENGYPVDVSGKEFHYIKVATASNINAGSFGEKSTEVSMIARTVPQDKEPGRTSGSYGVTLKDGEKEIKLDLSADKRVYEISAEDMEYITLSLEGASEEDNVYINNKRISPGGGYDTFRLTKETGNKLVRIIIQNGDKEPLIFLLDITSSKEKNERLIGGIRIGEKENISDAKTDDGINYTYQAGVSCELIKIAPITGEDIKIKINGEDQKESYSLSYGENTFSIEASDGSGITDKAYLTVIRKKPSSSQGGSDITVYFALYGDEAHDGKTVHIFSKSKSGLPVWRKNKAYSIKSGSAVLDLIEYVFGQENMEWENSGGNYISSVNRLSEFTNGENSGWMYSVNGKYPSAGISDQILKNGDKVILHYTDDYTKEGTDITENLKGGTGKKEIKVDEEELSVSFDTNGGGEIATQKVKKNDLLTEPTAPQKAGYSFLGWYTDKELLNEYDFSSKVERGFILYAKWKKEAQDPGFYDVSEKDWFYDAVCYIAEKGIMEGTGDGFEPESPITRAMAVTVIYRMEDNISDKGENVFSDIKEDSWYYNAVCWAAENGIAKGIGEGLFMPDKEITREQLAVFLFRYAEYKGDKTDTDAGLLSYADADMISQWAEEAVRWALANNIITGEDNSRLSPKNSATRAQLAMILMNYLK